MTNRVAVVGDAQGPRHRPLKVMMCHNFYRQWGGEDQCHQDEVMLLRAHGHEVVTFTRDNADVESIGPRVAAAAIWNPEAYRSARRLIRRERPDLVHCNNTFPLLSPSVYHAARAEGVPVLQVLHNYRLMCPAATLYREGRICEDCLPRSVPWPAIRHRCYRESAMASATVATLLSVHRALGTWTRSVDLFSTVSEFARRKLIEGGIPAGEIVVKPNFVHPDPGCGAGGGEYMVFVGRLSPEKGIETLLAAWERLPDPIGLKILGDGPLADRVREAASGDPRIEWLGQKPMPRLLSVIADASCLICPSIWYETFGRVIAESFSTGTPVIASRLGAMAELVDDGRTGFLVEPGDPADLVRGIRRLLSDPARVRQMRHAARSEFERRYTAERNYGQLIAIYDRLLGRGRPSSSGDTQGERA